MSLLGGAGKALAEIVETCANIKLQLAIMEKSINQLKDEFAGIRLEHVKLEGRLSRLEENRETLKEQLERIADNAVSKVEIMKSAIEADLRIQNATVVNEMKIRLLQIESEGKNNK